MGNLGFVRCAIKNLATKIYDSQKTASLIKDDIVDATSRNIKVLIYPELCMTGYSCQDLFYSPALLNEATQSIGDITHFSSSYEPIVVVGAPLKVSGNLYNCAFVIHKGKICGIVPKQNITEYEKRWFTPYQDTSINSVKLFNEDIPFGNLIFSSSLGFKLGIEIGDDLYSVIPPSSYMALAGANIIANLSADYELVGKDSYRQETIKSQSTRTISAYLYTSSGIYESTGDVVYGGSGYIFKNGDLMKSFKRFSGEPQLSYVDIDVEELENERISNSIFKNNKGKLSISYNEIEIKQYPYYNLSPICPPQNTSTPFIPDSSIANEVYKEIFSIQSTALARRLTSIRCKKVTLGISGGLDSTLALLVCCEAFKSMNLSYSDENSKIIGVTMPGFGTTDRTYNNAVKLCNELGIPLQEISIKDVSLQTFSDIGHDPNIHDVTYENVQARARTSILMNLANKHNAILVGTGDLSEAALGWCTYNGDHMSMYNVNCSIPKTLIRPLIRWYASECFDENSKIKEILLDIIDTPISPELLPTDGKKVVQKTENSVGPYEVIDFFIYHFIGNHFSKEKILFLAKDAFAGRYSYTELVDFFNKFHKRFFTNQFKRNCCPDGPKVTSISLSPKSWMMPSDIGYNKGLI